MKAFEIGRFFLQCMSVLVVFYASVLYAGTCTEKAKDSLERHTFRLVASGRTDGIAIQQTAFRLSGHAGLITALHGVVGAKAIEASRPNDQEFMGDLVITEFDSKSDLARLMPASGVWDLGKSGLEYGGQPKHAQSGKDLPFDRLCIGGFPESTPILLLSEAELRPKTVKLIELIGAKTDLLAFSTYISETESPHPQRAVFSVDDPLRPGESGAPMVDDQGKVVAIVNGGLRKGAVNLNWALPLSPTCLFSDNECETGRGNIEAITRRIVDAREAFQEAVSDSDLFGESYLRLPLDFGTKITGPDDHPFLGPHRKIRAEAVLNSCTALQIKIQMMNMDRAFGYCIRPRILITGKNHVDVLMDQEPWGRLCLGSVLEDEAILRIWELVSNKPISDPIRQMLGVDAFRYNQLGKARMNICRQRYGKDDCGPYRSNNKNDLIPPFRTQREDSKFLPLDRKSACVEDGSSNVYSITWHYNPDLKPEGLFETLDIAEKALKRAAAIAKAAPAIEAIATGISRCHGDSLEACLPDVARGLLFDSNGQCKLKGRGGECLCHLIWGM